MHQSFGLDAGFPERKLAAPSLASFDSDIIEWMRKNPKYCLSIAKELDKFVSDIEV